jgi:hypothetical protein
MPSEVQPFRAKARLIRSLGNELIRDSGFAVFVWTPV